MYDVNINIFCKEVLKNENIDKDNIVDAIKLVQDRIKFADGISQTRDNVMGKIEIINDRGFVDIECNFLNDIYTVGVDIDGSYISQQKDFDGVIEYLDQLIKKIEGK